MQLAHWRRAYKQRWIPAGCGRRAGRNYRRRRSDFDQNDCRSGHRDRRGRVHHGAERAVIGGGVERVDVGDLDDSQQREQKQANHGSRVCGARFAMATAGRL
jgi:hypothetical protein